MGIGSSRLVDQPRHRFYQSSGLLDPHVAQVERLARLDREFLADRRAGLTALERGAVGEAIRRAGDQDREGDAAVGIQHQRGRVVHRIDHVQVSVVGGGEAGPVVDRERDAGGDDHLDEETGETARDRLAVGTDEPRPGRRRRVRAGR